MHSHRCGFAGPEGYDPTKGCGHVWEHGEECAGKPDKHRCPQCGRRGWNWRWMEDGKRVEYGLCILLDLLRSR